MSATVVIWIGSEVEWRRVLDAQNTASLYSTQEVCGVAALTVDDDQLSKIPGIVQPEWPSTIDGTVSPYYQTGEMLVPLVFVSTLFTAHWWSGKSAVTVFLDMCVHRDQGFTDKHKFFDGSRYSICS